jgi:hypothetical protein
LDDAKLIFLKSCVEFCAVGVRDCNLEACCVTFVCDRCATENCKRRLGRAGINPPLAGAIGMGISGISAVSVQLRKISPPGFWAVSDSARIGSGRRLSSSIGMHRFGLSRSCRAARPKVGMSKHLHVAFALLEHHGARQWSRVYYGWCKIAERFLNATSFFGHLPVACFADFAICHRWRTNSTHAVVRFCR